MSLRSQTKEQEQLRMRAPSVPGLGGSAPLSPVMKAWPGTRTLSPPALGRPGREFFPDPSQPAPLERPLVRTEAHAPPGRGL